jgi:prepilin-type N-terminal cleavage/methylation domain-containing protein
MLTTPRTNRGFTLMELLVALGVFSIGFVAIAAMFPPAIMLQRETADAILGRQAAQSAVALVRASDLRTADVTAFGFDTGNSRVQWPNNYLTNLQSYWPMIDRSFPISETQLLRRQYYCVPMFRIVNHNDAGTPRKWRVSMMVLRGTDNQTAVPTVQQLAGTVNTNATLKYRFMCAPGTNIRVGDFVLDSNGVYHRIVAVTATYIDSEGIFARDPVNGEPTAIYYATPRGAVFVTPPVTIEQQ